MSNKINKIVLSLILVFFFTGCQKKGEDKQLEPSEVVDQEEVMTPTPITETKTGFDLKGVWVVCGDIDPTLQDNENPTAIDRLGDALTVKLKNGRIEGVIESKSEDAWNIKITACYDESDEDILEDYEFTEWKFKKLTDGVFEVSENSSVFYLAGDQNDFNDCTTFNDLMKGYSSEIYAFDPDGFYNVYVIDEAEKSLQERTNKVTRYQLEKDSVQFIYGNGKQKRTSELTKHQLGWISLEVDDRWGNAEELSLLKAADSLSVFCEEMGYSVKEQ